MEAGAPVTTVRTITAPADLDAGLIREIAAGQPVDIARGLAAEVDRRCDQARAVLRDGGPVYGVNTGMGAMVGVRLTETQQRAHQRNLLLARATGGPPWLDAADARAVIAARLRTFLSGDSGVSAALCQRLVDLLDAEILPAVPRTGVGYAGEIVPLAHAFGPLAGIGRVLTRGGGTRPVSGPGWAVSWAGRPVTRGSSSRWHRAVLTSVACANAAVSWSQCAARSMPWNPAVPANLPSRNAGESVTPARARSAAAASPAPARSTCARTGPATRNDTGACSDLGSASAPMAARSRPSTSPRSGSPRAHAAA